MAEEKKEEVKKPDEDWMTKKWRPLMAMMYMACCLCDFALFPIMFTVVQFWETQAANDAFRQWVPITLQGGGLFHVAMGGVLGVTAYGRTQEKLGGVASAPTPAPAGLPTQTIAPTPAPAPVVAQAPVAPVVVAQAPIAPAAPTVSSTGKLAPPPAEQPLI
jgi:hypothetical protein